MKSLRTWCALTLVSLVGCGDAGPPAARSPAHTVSHDAAKSEYRHAMADSAKKGAMRSARAAARDEAAESQFASTGASPTTKDAPLPAVSDVQTYSGRTVIETKPVAGAPAQLARADALKAREELPVSTPEPPSSETYHGVTDNAFITVDAEHRLSTFSIDVDTASYANVRRFLQAGSLPPAEAVRIEELINYFTYSYPSPSRDVPFSANIEVADCPWNPEHDLVRIGLKGREIPRADRAVSNLVFLIDVSGSMNDQNKLPLVKAGLRMLVEQLTENDRVAIVVYAGAAGLVLDSTTADKKRDILTALENLQAGGSTNGGRGIQLAYDTARRNLIKKGVNRVILCSDGDFNVGTTSIDALVSLVQSEAKAGIFLTVLGFGTGNLKDATMEALADKGNGNYGYIDTESEAKKLLVDQLQGTLVTIAKDVKIQVDFNPRKVQAYRLIGYENRILAHEDFDNDQKDAGEIGSGHTVTALYEIQPARDVPAGTAADAEAMDALLMLKLRYKQPEAEQSQLVEHPALDRGLKFSQASSDFAWAASVAAYGMILRNSPYKGNATLPAVLEMAQSSRGTDASGYRAEFIELVRRTSELRAETQGRGRSARNE